VWRWATLLGLALALPGWLTPAAAQVAAPAAAQVAAPAVQRIEVFVREGCPHCAKAEEFLAVLGREQPQLDIAPTC